MKNLKYSTNKENLFIYIALFFCFEPKLFVKFPFINLIYIIGLVVVFFIVILKNQKSKSSYTKMFVSIIIYRFSFMPQTVINNGDITMWGYFSIVLATLCLMFDFYMVRDGINFIRILSNVLLCLLTINTLVIFLYPNGVVENIYFIGIRTRFTDLIFPLIAFCLILDIKENKTISKRTLLAFIFSVINVVKMWIATALLGIMIIMVVMLFQNSKFIKKILNVKTIVVFAFIINYLVVYADIIKYFGWIITDILHKSITLSSRTWIWNEAIRITNLKPIFGYGMSDNGNFVYIYNSWGTSCFQSHNNWLQLMHDGGIILIITFIIPLIICHKRVKHYISTKTAGILLATLMTFMVMMISEIYSYTPYFYLVIFLLYHISKIEIQGGKT